MPSSVFFEIHYDLEQALRMPVDLVDFDFQSDFFELLKRVGELKELDVKNNIHHPTYAAMEPL